MQRFGIKSAVLGCAVIGIIAQSASAVVLYNSTGFEVGYTPPGQFLNAYAGWDAGSTGTPLQTAPFTAVYAYSSPTGSNTQYAQLTASNHPVASNTSYFNTTTTPFNSANSNDDVAITFSMNLLSGTNNPFFGIIATTPTGDPIGQIGVNGTTGALVGSTGGTFVAPANQFVNYQLLLDFNSQTYKTFIDTGSGFAQQGGTTAFITAATVFGTADVAVYNLGGTGTYSGAAQMDDLLVQTVVPEPASLGMIAAAGLLMGGRRARNRA